MTQGYHIEKAGDLHLVRGKPLPLGFIKPGQIWLSLVDLTHAVVVDGAEDGVVFYTSKESGTSHDMKNARFQSKYALLSKDGELPKELAPLTPE